MSFFLDISQIADVAQFSRQAIEKAVLRCQRNPSLLWRGAALVVRQVHGRGGRSGVSYQVRTDSLPADLQELLKTFRNPIEGRLNHGKQAQVERDWFYSVLHPAIIQPKGSAGRSKRRTRRLPFRPSAAPTATRGTGYRHHRRDGADRRTHHRDAGEPRRTRDARGRSTTGSDRRGKPLPQ